jgi:nucleoside-diphosphate-sugar epimerase
MSARRVLVAGCGDVGARLAIRLQHAGDAVAALSRSGRGVPEGVAWLRADLTDPATLAGLPGPWDALVFLPAPDRRDPGSYRALFVDGLGNLLDALETPPARLLYVSSTAVYGEDAGEWVDEDTPPRPPAFNGALLLEGEALARTRVAGATVVRLTGLYGPGRDRMRRLAQAGEPGKARWSNRIHVDDAAAALAHVLALAAPEPLYLASDDRPVREDELLACLRGDASPAPPRGGGSGRRVRNARLRASGWCPGFPDFRSGYGLPPEDSASEGCPALL